VLWAVERQEFRGVHMLESSEYIGHTVEPFKRDEKRVLYFVKIFARSWRTFRNDIKNLDRIDNFQTAKFWHDS
jgi:hypothetical protein